MTTHYHLTTLASLEGRVPARKDGRPSRTRTISTRLRERFVEVMDDDGNEIIVYVTEDGTVRRDVNTVQEELEAKGLYKGMKGDDGGDVDLDALMQKAMKQPLTDDGTGVDPVKKIRRLDGDVCSSDPDFDPNDVAGDVESSDMFESDESSECATTDEEEEEDEDHEDEEEEDDDDYSDDDYDDDD